MFVPAERPNVLVIRNAPCGNLIVLAGGPSIKLLNDHKFSYQWMKALVVQGVLSTFLHFQKMLSVAPAEQKFDELKKPKASAAIEQPVSLIGGS